VLATTLWFVVALGVLATVLLDAAAVFGRAAVTAAANHAVETAAHDAVADYQNRLQAAIGAIVAQASPAPLGPTVPSPGTYAAALAALPNPLEATLNADSSATPSLSIAYRVVPTTISSPDCAAAADAPGADTVAWLQCADVVDESRLSLQITIDVDDASGEHTLAHREEYVTLRLFAEPPYSAPVGRKDGGADDPIGDGALDVPAHEGDLGGDTISGVAAPAVSPWPAGGTLIHVRYECVDGAGHCANAAPPDPDAALRSNARWTNGNVLDHP
jgi:hypothetical protein